jgi:hypothetical protein
VVALALGKPCLVYAWGSATHIYIPDEVLPDCGDRINLYYGSVAPDLYDRAPTSRRPTAFQDTHYNYIDLRPSAWSPASTASSNGWLTHNEAWAADRSAHIQNPLGGKGYVVGKAEQLTAFFGFDPNFAHLVVEAAVDLLVKENHDPGIGNTLRRAAQSRSPQDLYLLASVLVLGGARTDLGTLVWAELAHRAFLIGYGTALALPSPFDRLALAGLFVGLAREAYGTEIPLGKMLVALKAADALCRYDYLPVITETIQDIKTHI